MRRMTIPALAIVFGLGVPAAADAATDQEARCEAAREAKLAPERKSLIEQCVTQEKKERGFCEQYYRDHGDGGVRGGHRVERKYDNLPECVAAREAGTAGTGSSERTSPAKSAPRDSAKEGKNRDSDSGKRGKNRDSDSGVNRNR